MALTTYKHKRSFDKTPEPTGGKAKDGELRFVVQKHDATRLHYDFRLEMGGVLKSWAVPKGPSLDPTVRRLAMEVEDHPYDYRNFEGIIPEGNYGAGTVIVWDEGTYTPIENIRGKKDQEKYLLKQLKEGSLKFVLHGKKLRGEFALVKTKGMGENSWLLIKHRDKYASDKDITEKDKSVQSGKSIDKVAATSKNTWKSNKPAVKKSPPKAISKKSVPVKKKKNPDLSDAPETPFPKTISPMLATLVDKPFDREGWLYEIKWDGYRAISLCNRNEVNIISRNNKSFDDKFYPVHEALKRWGIYGVVDGEIAVLNEKGISDFGSLQNWRSEADGELIYYVFDLLWLDGHDLTELPLTRRRELLQQNLPAETDVIRMSENFDVPAAEFLEAAHKMGLEGIIAKKADSTYQVGERTRDWLKIKANKRQEVVIGGFTQNEGSSKTFSALLAGVYAKGVLEYIGKIGTGFSNKTQKELMEKFRPLITKKIPFSYEPDVSKPSRFRPNPPNATATWLDPKLVCEVSYAEITSDGLMRHPSFEGLREDKNAKDVMKETPIKTKDAVNGSGGSTAKAPVAEKTNVKKSAAKKSTAKKTVAETILKPVKAGDRKTLLNPTEETQVKKINGHELKFSHLSKIFWPKEKFTKRDLLNYYYQVAPYIIPYLKDRPQSLNRFPNGINGPSFYQKDVTGKAPDWIGKFPYTTSEGEHKNYMTCNKDADLLYMVNLGCIEMHPWNSTIHTPDNPDWCLIDLDPSEKNTFEQVIQVAQMTKVVLDEIGVEGYCKTSGSTGMHIYIPLLPKYSYDECQLLGRWIATQVNERLPDITSLERIVKARKNKLYVDFLQNRPGATLAAPYSARPKPGGTVSMPLHWEEVKKGLQLKQFTIKNSVDRIRREGDIFKPVLGKGTDLIKVLKKIS